MKVQYYYLMNEWTTNGAPSAAVAPIGTPLVRSSAEDGHPRATSRSTSITASGIESSACPRNKIYMRFKFGRKKKNFF